MADKNRYIDASGILIFLNNCLESKFLAKNVKEFIVTLINMINSMHSIDLIRCKDCAKRGRPLFCPKCTNVGKNIDVSTDYGYCDYAVRIGRQTDEEEVEDDAGISM